jgi:hypothetical protein
MATRKPIQIQPAWAISNHLEASKRDISTYPTGQ